MSITNIMWAEKYRPTSLDEIVLAPSLKEMFGQLIKEKQLPNMLFYGPHGTGKTTVAKVLAETQGADWMMINASMRGGIDTLRNDIMQFATTMSITGGRKVVILDEADYLNPQTTQPAFRGFLDEFSAHCSFILTCNYPARLIEPLRSRFQQYDFKIPSGEQAACAKQSFARVKHILTAEGVEFDESVVKRLVVKHFPDIRQTITALQKFAMRGAINTGALSHGDATDVDQLVQLLKKRDFNAMRKWVAEMSPDPSVFFRDLYEASFRQIPPQAIPQLVVILGKYQYQAAFVADQEINLVACLTEVMADCEF